MKIKLAPSLLLSVLSCSNDGVTAFSSVQQSARTAGVSGAADASHRQQVALSMSNDFDKDYSVEVDRHGNILDISATGSHRRETLARLAATAAAGTFLGGKAAFAAQTEFSESGVSDASLVRKTSSDYDGNEAGPVGAGDEGSQPPPAKQSPSAAVTAVKASLPILELPNAYSDPKVLGAAAVTVFGLAAYSVSNGESSGEAAAPSITTAKGTPPPSVPYGLTDAGKKSDVVYTPPPPPKSVEPVKDALFVEKDKKPSWALNTPTPYGIENPAGKNPFIKEVKEYCVGGKVTEECAQTIKGYLDNLSITGAVASSGEVKVIVGYLDSLGSNSPSSSQKKKAGAAFTSYLDALSGGSAPPPSSARAVKTYLDTILTGSAPKPAEKKPMDSPVVAAAPAVPEPVAEVPEPTPEPAVATPDFDFSEYDNRLDSIEGRVTSLEAKVDALPDKVFEKIEAWQTQHEDRLTNEVKKIVEAMAPPPAPAAPEPVAEVPVPIPEPVVSVPELEPAAPSVPHTPLASAIPQRGGMPQPTGGPKKGFRFGGGSSWKTSEPMAAAIPAPVVAAPEPVPEPVQFIPEPVQFIPEPVQFTPEPVTPAVPHTPLAAAIPQRGGMPQPSAVGPKKGFGFGGGSSWKTSEPMAAGAPEPVSEPVAVAEPEPVAPAVVATPLAAIPQRGGMPQPSAGSPKKGYGFGGGASWKTNNMGP